METERQVDGATIYAKTDDTWIEVVVAVMKRSGCIWLVPLTAYLYHAFGNIRKRYPLIK